MFSMVFCLLSCILYATYMQMGANRCKFMFCCTSMLPPMSRVALNSGQQS